MTKRSHTIRYLCFVFAVIAAVSISAVHCAPPVLKEEPKQEKAAQEQSSVTEPAEDAGVTPDDAGAADDVVDDAPDVPTPDTTPDDAPPQALIQRPSSGWCSRVSAGPASPEKAILAMSKAHAHIRFLGIHKGYPTIDAQLAKALQGRQIGAPAMLEAYAKDVASVCALTAVRGGLQAASVTMQGDVAVIRPGMGDVAIPDTAKAAAIDLRGLPDSTAATAALRKAVAAVIAQNAGLSQFKVRKHDGMGDEYFSAQNAAYGNRVVPANFAPIKAVGQSALPLAFIVGDILSPMAATVAGSMRLAQRAWIVGKPVPAAVAESRWIGVGPVGVAYRVSTMYHNNAPWPDSIPADKPLSELDATLKGLASAGSPGEVPTTQPERADTAAYKFFRQFHREKATKANVTAALLIAHGALRAFFPYFKTVGDNIDARLEEVLATIAGLSSDNISGIQSRNLMRRFGESIRDGHCFVYSVNTGQEYRGYMPVSLDLLGGKPVVVRSGVPDLKPGDTIEMIGGVKASEWFEKEYKRTSAATPGYRFNLAARELQSMIGPMSLEVTGADGAKRTVQVTPQNLQAYQAFFQNIKPRQAGFLKSFGADEIYYINLDGPAIQAENLTQLLTDAQKAKGLIIDMRGYPGAKAWQIIANFSKIPLPSPFFRTFNWNIQSRQIVQTDYNFQPKSPNLGAPAVYLTGPGTVSAAEHLGTMLKQANRVTFMGRTSAGTNGNITGIVLPGGLIFTYTGMEILWRDKSVFHGVGLVPDKQFEPTPQDIAAGKDPLLDKAITHLRSKIAP